MEISTSFLWIFPVVPSLFFLEVLWAELFQKYFFSIPEANGAGIIRDYAKRWGSFCFLPIFGDALIEEFIFRLCPIGIVMVFYDPVLALVTLVSSQIFFGVAHGSWKNIFSQGIGGIWYIFLFLIVGGLENPVPALLVCAVTHTLWNLGCLYGWYEPIKNSIRKIL